MAMLLATTPMPQPKPKRSPEKEPEDDMSFKFQTLVLMRGLPGSGKSSIAESLVGGSPSHVVDKNGYRYLYGANGVVCTTDSYFYDEWKPEGSYMFDPARIGHNHGLNQAAVGNAMSMGIPTIVVDNTHVQKWETDAYVALAMENGYKIVVVEVPHVSIDLCEMRNNHGVPRAALERMVNKWEKFSLDGSDGEKIG
jgi:NEDD4-binding protein 2